MKTDETPEVQAQRAAAYVRLSKHLLTRYVECFPNYEWTDEESAIDLMAAEIKLARYERDRAINSLAERPAQPATQEGR